MIVCRVETEQRESEILLPEWEIFNVRRAWVLAGGFELGLSAGDQVIVRHRAGKRTADWDGEDYETVFFGASGGKTLDRWWRGNAAVDPVRIRLDEVVMARVDGETVTPLGRQVLVSIPQKHEKVGSLYLPDDASWREPVADVVAVGESVTGLSAGDRVVIHEGALVFDKTLPDGYALILEDFIYARVI